MAAGVSENLEPVAFDSRTANRKQRAIPAWALSMLLHGSVIVVLAITVQGIKRDVPGEPDRPGNIVLASRTQGKTDYFDGSGQQSESNNSSENSNSVHDNSSETLPSESESPLSIESFLPDSQGILSGTDSGTGLPGSGSLTNGGSNSRSGSGDKGTTTVFGAQGSGNKFVYIFDRSGSMDGRPLDAAKSELINSLRKLEDIHQFSIIFYNKSQRIFDTGDGRRRLVFANEQGLNLADRFIRSMTANGGTEHLPAITMALEMQPDVIFFLTDAELPELFPHELQRIRRLNKGTVIHAIEFGFGPYNGKRNFLVKLAEQNDGSHVYVDTSKFRN